MKEKIQSGMPVFGVSVTFPAPELVEMIAIAGFDWILIDCEHGSHDVGDVYDMVLACELHGVTPIVRPRVNRPEVILRYMDRGAMGVQAPHVNTKADAIAVVRAVKFHPQGSRGLGGGRKTYGLSTKEFVEASNRETLVCVQIEHEEGLRNLDEILTVDGVDVFFVGPSDLSQSLGFPGQRDHPIVRAAVDGAFERIRNAGKASGTPGGPEEALEHVRKGILYHYTHVPTMVHQFGEKFFKVVGEATSPGRG